MTEVFVTGRGLASALGGDLAAGLTALREGGVRPGRLEVTPGVSWPFFAIDAEGADWSARARRIIRHVAQESGALNGPRTGALFVATSSIDIEVRIDAIGFEGDYQTFAETVAEWIDWRGPVLTVSTACTSGVNALLSARTLIRHGAFDSALVLGLELRNRVSVGGFGAMQLLSKTAALPFGAERDGILLGEAVGAIYVSSEPSRWRIAGGANVVDGRDPTGIVPEAVIGMYQQALASCGLDPGDISLVKVQAAGSVVADATEATSLRDVFGQLPPLVSFKAAIGHTLGASGVAEAALTMACVEAGVWPAFVYPKAHGLDTALIDAPPQNVGHVMVSILGFGGGHATVVLEDTAA